MQLFSLCEIQGLELIRKIWRVYLMRLLRRNRAEWDWDLLFPHDRRATWRPAYCVVGRQERGPVPIRSAGRRNRQVLSFEIGPIARGSTGHRTRMLGKATCRTY